MEGPVAPSERIAEIDYVRGLALLGIFIMNLPTFTFSVWQMDTAAEFPGHLDRIVESMRDLFIQGKFNAMFSFLFGVGFTIQMERLTQARPDAATSIYLRRVAILFGLGLLHGCVFWAGDILHLYAAMGLLLLALRRVPVRWLVVLIAFSMVVPTISRLLHDHFENQALLQSFFANADADAAREVAIFQHGSVIDGVQRTFETFQYSYFGFNGTHRFAVIFSEILTTMLIGLIAGRGRWFEKVSRYPEIVIRVNNWAFIIGAVALLLLHIASQHVNFRSPNGITYFYGYSSRISRVVVMIFYVTALLRLIQSTRWRLWLQPVANAGRMPLTNYLFQTFLGLLLFRPWGFGLYGRVGPAACLAIAVGLYLVVQLPLSTLWLRGYRFGPLEYLWRAATYGYWPTMRRSQAG
jgi:uncharacterized protein